MAQDVLRLLLLDPMSPHGAFRRLLAAGSHPHQVTTVATLDAATQVLGATRVDAVVVAVDCLRTMRDIRRIRMAAGPAALVMLRNSDADRVPLEAADVGVQSTLDVWTLDARTLWLTLQLAVERAQHAVARARADRLARVVAEEPQAGVAAGEQLLHEVDTFVADAIRFGRPLSLAMVQVEGVAGCRTQGADDQAEQLLDKVVRLLQDAVRTSDVLGRLEDHLVIAMPGTDGRHASRAVRRLQAGLTARRHAVEGAPVQLTVGLSVLRGLMSVDELVFNADVALAEARDRSPGAVVVDHPVAVR